MSPRTGIALALSALVCVLVAASPASAETSLAVSPAILDLSGPMGGSGSVDIRVDNEGDRPFDVVPSMLDLDAAAGLPSAASWTRVSPSRVTVEPGSTGLVRLRLDIPGDIEPGGHYAAVSIDTTPVADDGATTGVSGRIVVPVLIAVTGDEEHPTPTAQPVLERAALFVEPDGRFLARVAVRNEGGVHIPLVGAVTVERVRPDGEREQVAVVDLPTGRVLPGVTRLFPAADQLSLAPGTSYEASFELAPPARGRIDPAPVIDETITLVASPSLALEGLTACALPDGALQAQVTLVNDSSLGVSPDVAIWAETSSGDRAAVARPLSRPLVWPEASVTVPALMSAPSVPGEYQLIAEASFAGGQSLRTETTIVTAEDAASLPACEPLVDEQA